MCWWEKQQLIFHNYATGKRIAADPLICLVLACFERWKPADALFARMNQFSRSSLRRTVFKLAKHSLLQRSDRLENKTERAIEKWRGWNPAGGFFHFTTKDVPYTLDPFEEERFLRRQDEKSPMPRPVKRYRHALKVPLPSPQTDGEFAGVLLERRTWREFSSSPVPISKLATLLGLTWGIQEWAAVPGGRLPLKTSPSGGARHPIEAYVLALRVTGLQRGLYHYAADCHRLELLRSDMASRDVVGLLAGQRWYGSAAALVIMTAVFPRVWWKYQFSRAYRVVLADAGHICQTFCLVATWLGLAPFCTMAFADSRLEQALDVDGVTESPIYVAGVGSRPVAA